MKTEAHRRFVEGSILRASLPDDVRIIQEGAEDHLIKSLAPYVKAHEMDGGLVVPRVEVNGALVPGQGPDGMMDMKELLDHVRADTSPLPVNLSFCFRSNAAGSGTHKPNAPAPTASKWKDMTDQQQSDYVSEHGVAAAKKLMEADFAVA